MKLLYIALFTIQLRNIDAVSEPVPFKEQPRLKAHCDDSAVLAAVDFTLRKFNAEQKAGNKFALYRVISALTQVQETGGIKYIVEFSIYETDCPIGSNALWKSCNYRDPKIASSGKCNSETIINRIRRINKVTSLNCTVSKDHKSIFPEKGPCVGCEKPVENDSFTLSKVSAYATEEFNRNRTLTNYFRIGRVHKLSTQVVAGLIYRMEFLHRETECSKDQPLPYENVIKCPFKADGKRLQCNSTVIEQVWLNYTSTTVTCEELTQDTLMYGGWGPFILLAAPIKNTTEGSQSRGVSASAEHHDSAEGPTAAEHHDSAEGPTATEHHDSAEGPTAAEHHDSAEHHASAEDHNLGTCPGEPWKSLHHVKPASPPIKDHHEHHEIAERLTVDDGLSASV